MLGGRSSVVGTRFDSSDFHSPLIASCSNPVFDPSSHLPHCMLEIPLCCMVTLFHVLGYFDHIWALPQLLECSQTTIENTVAMETVTQLGNSTSVTLRGIWRIVRSAINYTLWLLCVVWYNKPDTGLPGQLSPVAG